MLLEVMSLQRPVDHLTKIIRDASGKLARCPPSKIRELLTKTKKKWEQDSLWTKMIVISCLIAISLDPLFLYIPFIDEEKKCFGMDKKLRNFAMTLRSLTDITFVVDIGYQIYEGIRNAYKEINQKKEKWELDWQTTLLRRDEIIPFAKILARELTWCSLVTDLLSVFPMPQLLVVHVFFKMRRPGYLEQRTRVVNFFLLSQYLPRIYRIILSSRELTRTIEIWVKVAFNLFLYFLASHVIGALWYFFSIQREISCWHQACQNNTKHEGCKTTFYCYDRNTSTKDVNTFFDEHCKVNVPFNETGRFEYGIFLDSLKSGIAANNYYFPTKLAYSFWWGLRNLSNFGTNLSTSNYVWENLFAIFISVTGLLLFIYLIGNIEALIHMRTTQSVEIRKKIKSNKEAIDKWMKKNDIDDGMKKEIMKNINKKLEEDKDADLENLFHVLPGHMKNSLKLHLCFKILSQVELLKLMNDKVLRMMCDYLTQVTYATGHIIFPRGHKIDRMLLIIEGTVWPDQTPNSTYAHVEETTKESGAAPEGHRKGCVFGEELLIWASNKSGLQDLPSCAEDVVCKTKVEGFALSAQDLQIVVSKCEIYWGLNFDT